MSIKVKLLRPLDGKAVGATVEYSEADAQRLEKRGAVQIISEKAAPAPLNKMAQEPANKAAAPIAKKGR